MNSVMLRSGLKSKSSPGAVTSDIDHCWCFCSPGNHMCSDKCMFFQDKLNTLM